VLSFVYRHISALGLALLPLMALAEPYDPSLAPKIDTFLAGHGSPITGNGSVFFSSGVTNNVDPRLIVAIAGAESTFGTNWVDCPASGYNAWSWFYNDGTGAGRCALAPFSSFADGIQKVTSGLRRLYLNRNLNTIPLIGSVYCGTGCSSWASNVTQFYTELGGDTSDLTFASSLIDFEQFTGPCCFTGIQPPLTVGIATVSGGEILGGTSFLPVDQSTVYGTASFCPGCLPSIAIAFAKAVSNFSVFVINGNTVTVTYIVKDDQGGLQTITLAPNFESGAGTVSLPEKNVLLVLITSGSAAGGWDFFIDNVQFAPSS
jgi:hypothetical protein